MYICILYLIKFFCKSHSHNQSLERVIRTSSQSAMITAIIKKRDTQWDKNNNNNHNNNGQRRCTILSVPLDCGDKIISGARSSRRKETTRIAKAEIASSMARNGEEGERGESAD